MWNNNICLDFKEGDKGFISLRVLEILGETVKHFRVSIGRVINDGNICSSEISFDDYPILYSAIQELEDKCVLNIRHSRLKNTIKSVSSFINDCRDNIFNIVIFYFELSNLLTLTPKCNKSDCSIEDDSDAFVLKYPFTVESITPANPNNVLVLSGTIEGSDKVCVAMVSEEDYKDFGGNFDEYQKGILAKCFCNHRIQCTAGIERENEPFDKVKEEIKPPVTLDDMGIQVIQSFTVPVPDFLFQIESDNPLSDEEFVFTSAILDPAKYVEFVITIDNYINILGRAGLLKQGLDYIEIDDGSEKDDE